MLKTAAATLGLRLIGLRWTSAVGMGLGLAQLGEFSFLVLAEGVGQGVISSADYNRMLFVALGTLILTPHLLKFGLRWTGGMPDEHDEVEQASIRMQSAQHAIVIGVGPIGRQVASRLELMGVDVWLLDLSPINLHAFAQQGFHTVSGDARDPQVLQRADAARCSLAVVSVPDDEVASQIVRTLRGLNPAAAILVRCRYQANINRAKKAGASAVISEEAEVAGTLLRWCERFVSSESEPGRPGLVNDEENQ